MGLMEVVRNDPGACLSALLVQLVDFFSAALRS